MQELCCSQCAHFRPHYIKFSEIRYDPIKCGHCVFPRLKHRKADTLACVHFKPKDPPDAQCH